MLFLLPDDKQTMAAHRVHSEAKPRSYIIIFATRERLASIAAATWRPPDPQPLRMRRQGGQIFRATTRIYAEHIPTFVAAGAARLYLQLRG